MRARLEVNERQFRLVTYVALAALSVIVLTGAAVRLSDSGLGCPTWPRCYGHVYPPVALHPLIEFSNRALSGFVGLITIVVAVLGFTRRPFRRDLAWLAMALPAGVVCQAVLGGFTVREKLAPGFVMSHFLLSMVIIIFAVWLAWNATHEPAARPRSTDRLLVWAVRVLAILCAFTLAAGTLATAAGPHSGGLVGQHIKRLHFKGADTLEWAVNQHATIAAIFGVLTVLVWMLKRQRVGQLDPLEPLTLMGVLIAAQGLIGAVQYELKLPGQMVWVHVVMATLTWVVTLWAVATEGYLAKRKPPDTDEPLDTIVTEWKQSVSSTVTSGGAEPDVSLSILVVDDELDLREMLTRSFSREGHLVSAVGDGHAAIDRASNEHFDIVLLDVALGAGPDGYEVCRTLRARRNVVPIIMLTALDSEADAVLGLEAGADDYVTKPFGLAELRSRIRAVLRRAAPRASGLGSDIVAIGAVSLDRSRREVSVEGEPVRLTFSEFELLDALMTDPGRLLNRQELLRAIWGDSAYRDPRAIDVHIRHLREKLEPEPEKPKYILTVRGAGYRLGTP